MIMALSAAVLGITTFWVLAPILGWGREAAEEDASTVEREELLESRRQVLASIKDLEMEHQVGKLTPEDFQETREQLTKEAVSILRRIDAAGAGNAQGESADERDGR